MLNTSMAKKHVIEPPGDGKARDTRSQKCRREVAVRVNRAAALRGRKVADLVEPLLRKLASDVEKRMRSAGFASGSVIKAGAVPDAELSAINMRPETALLISRLAGANGVNVPVVLDDPTFRDAVAAEYLSALVDALAELGWEARPRRR